MRLGFALEYSLGHITHSENLKRVLALDSTVEPVYTDLPYDGIQALWAKLPGIRSNWSIRASIGAYLGMRRHKNTLDGAFFHTQVTSLFSPGFMRTVPSVVSLDATPLQYDSMGSFYNHTPNSNRRLEWLKKSLNTRAFNAARHLVTWSYWAKSSLIDDYGIAPEKITVIPPGIDTGKWDFAAQRKSKMVGPIRLLFVGGDFVRKGGETLLAAMAAIPADLNIQLDIVTQSRLNSTGSGDIRVHNGVKPNSDVLLGLYRDADIFVFPTRGDCLPLAVMEALSAALPVITTDVGALSEAVTHERSGLVVPPDDPEALAAAIIRLAENPDLRGRMSETARAVALERFDGDTNYHTLIELIKSVGKIR